MNVVLVVGHSKERKGARNKSFNIAEYDINNKLAKDIKDIIDVDIVYRTESYNKVPFKINELNPKFILSLHANGYNTNTSGSEILYYHTSKFGKKISGIFQEETVSVLGLKDRGIKAKTVEDRGGYILKYSYAPCIIMEPFFIDNDDDLLVFMCKYKEYVKVISKTIEDVYNNLI